MGKLYRSGQLTDLSSADKQLWQSLNINLNIDFRSVDERIKNPTVIPSTQKPNISILEIGAGNTAEIIHNLQNGKVLGNSMQTTMIEVNQYFVLNQTVVFQQFYHLLASDDQCVLFHCSDVKDRTGFAAILLTALGVSSEQFMQDYFLTSRYFIPGQVYRWFSERFGLNVPLNTILPLLEVRAAYLNGAFELINKQ